MHHHQLVQHLHKELHLYMDQGALGSMQRSQQPSIAILNLCGGNRPSTVQHDHQAFQIYQMYATPLLYSQCPTCCNVHLHFSLTYDAVLSCCTASVASHEVNARSETGRVALFLHS